MSTQTADKLGRTTLWICDACDYRTVGKPDKSPADWVDLDGSDFCPVCSAASRDPKADKAFARDEARRNAGPKHHGRQRVECWASGKPRRTAP